MCKGVWVDRDWKNELLFQITSFHIGNDICVESRLLNTLTRQRKGKNL